MIATIFMGSAFNRLTSGARLGLASHSRCTEPRRLAKNFDGAEGVLGRGLGSGLGGADPDEISGAFVDRLASGNFAVGVGWTSLVADGPSGEKSRVALGSLALRLAAATGVSRFPGGFEICPRLFASDRNSSSFE